MEKRKPHYALSLVRKLAEPDNVRATASVFAGAEDMGIDFRGMLSVVMSVTNGDFHKSMTTHADRRVWQDVYRPTTPAGEVYLKLTVIDDLLIVSFKEL